MRSQSLTSCFTGIKDIRGVVWQGAALAHQPCLAHTCGPQLDTGRGCHNLPAITWDVLPTELITLLKPPRYKRDQRHWPDVSTARSACGMCAGSRRGGGPRVRCRGAPGGGRPPAAGRGGARCGSGRGPLAGTCAAPPAQPELRIMQASCYWNRSTGPPTFLCSSSDLMRIWPGTLSGIQSVR